MGNRKTILIILTIINSFLFILGLFFGLGFLAVSRCGYAGVWAALFDLYRFECLVTLTMVSVIAFWVLVTVKKRKENFKFVRLVATVYLIISLIVIAWGIFFVLSYAGSTCTSQEVAIKADLSSLKNAGERYKERNNTYGEFCDSSDVERSSEGIENNKSKLICNDKEDEWAACANHDKNEYSCVDSQGGSFWAKKGNCDEDWGYTQCPAE